MTLLALVVAGWITVSVVVALALGAVVGTAERRHAAAAQRWLAARAQEVESLRPAPPAPAPAAVLPFTTAELPRQRRSVDEAVHA